MRDLFDSFAKDATEESLWKTDCKLHTPTHLLTALKTSIRLRAYHKSCDILLYLIENGQCSRQFVWQILSTLFIRLSWHRSPEFSELAGVFSKFTAFPTLEVNATVIFNMINNGQYDRAHDEISRCEGLLPSDSNSAHNLVAAMLLIYKFILQQYITNFEHHEHMDQQMAIETLLCRSYLFPLVAETCIISLARLKERGRKKSLNDKAKVEKFIYRYIEAECNANWGVCGLEHTTAILNTHSYRIGESVKFNILEEISQRDPGNAKVLELCQMHLILDQKQGQRSIKQESDIGTESEMSDSEDSSNSDNLITCLQLLFNFLDSHMYRQTVGSVRQGWSLLADVLRRVCIKGTHCCIKELAKIWHLDRKDWWIYFRTLKADNVDELVRSKGLICYLLESDSHPFVQKSLSLNNSSHLRSLIKQFHPSKLRMDQVVKSILNNKKDSRQPLVSTPQKETPVSASRVETFLLRYEHINSQKIAEEFSNRMNRQPLVSKQRYKREASAQSSTLNLYQMPISERLTKRYEYRRSSTPRSWRSTDGSELCSLRDGDSECEDPSWKVPEHAERDSAKSSILLQPAISEQSSDGESYAPSPGGEADNSNIEADWTTRLRSWCAKEGANCYETHSLSQQFVKSYESFKAKKFRDQGTVETYCWQEFLDDGIWREISDYESSYHFSSSNESFETHSSIAEDILSPTSPPIKAYVLEDAHLDRQSQNNSVRSVSSTITDYPNSMDRVLWRLGPDFEDGLNGKPDEAEYVVEGYVDELPPSSSKKALFERDTLSPDMFTEHESELEMLASSPIGFNSQKTISSSVLQHVAYEDRITSEKLTAKIKLPPPTKRDADYGGSGYKENDASKTARKPSSKKLKKSKSEKEKSRGEITSKKTLEKAEGLTSKAAKGSESQPPLKRRKSETKEEETHCKSPKKKRVHRSWVVDESISKPKLSANINQSTAIIQPTFSIRKKKSKKKSKANDEVPASSSADLHNWRSDLVEKILFERRKSK